MANTSTPGQPVPDAPTGRRSQAGAILLGAVLVLVAWRLVLTATGWRADFGESNYQQNLLRIESLQQQVRAGHPPIAVLAGTSVAGRLLPAYFEGGPLAGVVNLGLDGTSPAFALELLLREAQVPRLVLVETYLLHKGPAANEALIRNSLDSPAGHLVASDRMFHTESRPTTLLYSALKRGRDAAATGRPAPPQAPYWTNAPAPGAVERITRAIRELQARGATVRLVDIPVGKDWPPGPNLGEPVASQLVGDLHLSRLDCRAALQARGIEPRFTDGIHLDGPSARQVAEALGRLMPP